VNVEEKIKIPRIGHQKCRTNVNTEIPETYFRFSIAIPLYDDFINQLKKGFKNATEFYPVIL